MNTADQMSVAATALLKTLDDQQRQLAEHDFADDSARRWLEYRPEYRPGACLAGLSVPARKAAHRLLSTALSDHAYAQAMAIIGLEEVIDRKEEGRMHRHSGDYWINVFGDPAGAAPWAWRFEGHHLSVSMTIRGDEVSPAPVFFGANPARVRYGDVTVSRPLAPEEDLAWDLLAAMDRAARGEAVVCPQAPIDIRSSTSPRVAGRLEPLGVASSRLGPAARAALGRLVALYLDRMPPALATRERHRIAGQDLHVAWEGSVAPGARHYYRIQGDDLLIEYDTTDDGNHAHTVLRRPRSDFGDDVLAAHLRHEHDPAGGGAVG